MSAEKHAEKLIEVYLNWLLSTDTAAGWHQPSLLQSMIEFQGCVPPPSGNDKADLKMIREIEHLRRSHALLAEAREAIGRLPKGQRTCLLVHERTAGTYDRQGKRWSEKMMAHELGMTPARFRYNRKAGLTRLVMSIERGGTRVAA